MAHLKELLLSRQTAEEFYGEQREKPFFNQLVEFMCRFVCPPPPPNPRDRLKFFFWAALSTIISTTQNQVGLSFTVYTQIDAQTEISSAPADPFAGLFVTQVLGHKNRQNNGKDRGSLSRGTASK